MARSTHTVPHAGGIGPAALIAALLALLAALLSPPATAGTRPHVLPDDAARTSVAMRADSGPHTDDGRPAAARCHRDTTGERPSPPAPATLTRRCTADGPPRSTSTPLPAQSPPAPAQTADRHPTRAPPPPPGI
ncbi:hypothetical protein WDA79_08075 [Streptomyces sp. A475]|uniref:hypothetical protein n=1 Tax=Streptomyces sp. A475 TaxID=3131976 RepID=UPI0030C96EB3